MKCFRNKRSIILERINALEKIHKELEADIDYYTPKKAWNEWMATGRCIQRMWRIYGGLNKKK